MSDQHSDKPRAEGDNAAGPQDHASGPAQAAGSESAGTSLPAASGQGADKASDAGSKARTGQIMVMAPSTHGPHRSWSGHTIDDERNSMRAGASSDGRSKWRLSAYAAIFVLAAIAGVVGGSLATAGLGHMLSSEPPKADDSQTLAMQQSISQIGTDLAALKASLERSSKTDAAQFSKLNERIEKVEKAQAEPAAKLAKISETLEKLRVAAATPAPAAAAPAKETTASIPATTAAAASKPEPHRLPTISGWRIRDVANGGALLEGRDGLYEVYAGDPLPGVGRVDAIRRQDGRWVVVTSRGLIVAR
jgi:hypothetical protein